MFLLLTSQFMSVRSQNQVLDHARDDQVIARKDQAKIINHEEYGKMINQHKNINENT